MVSHTENLSLETISIAVNGHFVDKVPRRDQRRFNDSFENVELSVEALIGEIRRGHAFTAAHRRERHPLRNGTLSAYRRRENFLGAQHLALDFDNLGFADLLADPFIAGHAAFLYTTASHRADAPRSRAVFILDAPVAEAGEYAALAKALVRRFGASDQQCHDPARVFYGSYGCTVERLGKTLPRSALEPFIEVWRPRRSTPLAAGGAPHEAAPEITRIRSALAAIPPDPPELPYGDWLAILMGVHTAYPDEMGIALIEGWSPGYEGEVEEKFASFAADREERYTVATVFWHAKRHGWRDTSPRQRAARTMAPEADLATTVSIDVAAAQVRATVEPFLRGAAAPGSTLVITAPPGVGKTTAITDALRGLPAMPGSAIWALAPRHDLYSADWQLVGVKNVRGRSAQNCQHWDVADHLGKKGLPVDAILCSQCSLKRKCDYHVQFTGCAHRFAALPMLNTSYLAGAAAVVLDELTPRHFVEDFTITRDDLVRLNGDPRTDPMVVALACILLRELDAAPTRARVYGAELHGRLAGGSIPHLRHMAEKAQRATATPPSLPGVTLQDAAALPSMALNRLAGALVREFDWAEDGREPGCVTLDPHAKCYRVRRRRELPEWLSRMPLIILNATADADLLLDLLGRDRATCTLIDPRIPLPPEVEIVQLTDAYYGKGTLGAHHVLRDMRDAKPSLRHALERIRQVLAPEVPTGLITFKNLERAVAADLGIAPARTGHYNAITGSNSFSSLEQLILLGAFSPATDDIFELARAIYAGRKPLVEGEEMCPVSYPGYQDRDGLGLSFEIRTFVDPRVQRLYAESREGAMLQAAHRLRLLRPNGRARVRLIVATALPIPGLPPTEIVREQRNTDLTERLVAATMEVVDREGFATQKEIAKAVNVSTGTVRNHWATLLHESGLVEERRLVQRGRAKRQMLVATRPPSDSCHG